MKTLAQVLLLTSLTTLCKGECSLTYTTQPRTEITCSPYDTMHPDRTVRLEIRCEAMRNGDDSVNSFDLIWYRRRSCDGMVENLGPGSPQETGSRRRTDLIVENYQGDDSFSEEIPGEYWCQAVITNSTGQYLATESNVLTVLQPENYTGRSVCGGASQSTSSSKCAYPPASFTCEAACIGEKPTPTACIASKSTVQESSAPTPVRSLSRSSSWYSSMSSASSESVSQGWSSGAKSVPESDFSYFPTSFTYTHITLPSSSIPITGISSLLPRKQTLTQIFNEIPFTPSASTTASDSSVLEEESTDIIVPVLAALAAVFLVLLVILVAGIAITLILRQRWSRSKPKPTAGTLQEGITNQCYEKIALNHSQGSFQQPAEYELPRTLQISPQSPASAAANCASYSQTFDGTQVEMKQNHLQVSHEDNLEGPAHGNFYDTIADTEIHSAALQSSNEPTYSHLHQNQTSCEVSNGGHDYSEVSNGGHDYSEVSNGGHEYSELDHNKDVVPPPRLNHAPEQSNKPRTFDEPQSTAVGDPYRPSL